MKYPRKLSSGANNTVIVLSDTEVAKLFTEDTRSDIGSEAEKMAYANTVNGLTHGKIYPLGIQRRFGSRDVGYGTP
jgi:hypothetical protein